MAFSVARSFGSRLVRWTYSSVRRPTAFSVARSFGPGPVYRIGLYGGTASGKTCILTALGLGAGRAHPDGFSCVRQTRLPDGPTSSDGPSGWTPEDLRKDPVKAFERGNLWIREAERRLREGCDPQGNDISDPPLLLVYDFVAPGHGRRTVEVTDFAGELLNPNIPPEENAVVLHRRLATVDALLVLAEVPHEGQATDPLGDDLKTLEQALLAATRGMNAGPRLPIPVGLLLNKWDRRGGAPESPEQRRAEVAAFLESSPAHRGLFRSIAGIAQRVEAFAVSAFGRHVTERDDRGQPKPGFDRPATYPLHSFGLEDPFVWACRESDARHRAEVLERRPGASGLLNPLRCWPAWRRGTALLRRLPADTPEHAEVREVQRRGMLGTALQSVLGLIGVLMLAGFAEWWFVDAPAHAEVETVLHDPTADPVAVAAAEDWLDAYASSSWPRHRGLKWSALSPDDAGRSAAASREERDRSRWRAVEDAADPAVRLVLTKAYLRDFPSGLQHDDAQRSRDELAELVGPGPTRDANRAKWNDLRRRFDDARTVRDDAKLEAILAEYAGLSHSKRDWHPDDFTAFEKDGPAMGTQLSELKSASNQSQNYRLWKKEEQSIHSLIVAVDLGAAASALKRCRRQYEVYPDCHKEILDLIGNFPSLSDGTVKATVEQALRTRLWQPCVGKLEPLGKHTDYLELAGRTGQDALRKEIDRLKLAWDKQLYGDYFDEPTIERARIYAAQAPLKRMKADVEKLIAWNHDNHTQEKALRLQVKIDWNEWYYDSGVRVQLEIKRPGSDVWEEHLNQTEESKKNKTSGPFQGMEFRIVPKAAFEFRVRLRAEGTTYLLSERLEGSVSELVNAVDLLQEKTLTIKESRKTTVTLKVVGLDPRPLPEPWKD